MNMDIIRCPKCSKSLSVPPEAMGQLVQCPACRETFEAREAGAFQAQPAVPQRSTERDYPPQPPPPRDRYDPWQEDRDQYRRYPDRELAPHRGSTILALAIIGLLVCGPILGPVAWIMGTNDLKEMAAGRMDPSGEGSTRAGQVIGIVSTILAIISIVFMVFLIAMAGPRGAFR